MFLYIHPWQLLAEYKCRLTEADIVEEKIIWAQSRAKAEEERALSILKADVGEDFHKIGLPSGEDYGNTVSHQFILIIPGDQHNICQNHW